MMKKIGIFILIILITPLVAGVYGIIHDQLTYTISNEYFTKFKFEQFAIEPSLPIRMGVAYVGWMATWWMGVPLGIILGLVELIHDDSKNMVKFYYKSLPFIVLVVFLTGLCGLIYGRLFLVGKDLNWFFPDNLVNRKSFISVGSMHNFSYLGGLTGLATGIYLQIRYKIKTVANIVHN